MSVLDSVRAVFVPRGKDRSEQNSRLIWGRIPLCTKVSASRDTGGGLHIFEHTDMPKGGPVLAPAELATLEQWEAAGTPNN